MDIKETPFFIYGKIQELYHSVKRGNKGISQYMFFLYDLEDVCELKKNLDNATVNGRSINIENATFFKGDNYSDKSLPSSQHLISNPKTYIIGNFSKEKWLQCILHAKVEPGWANSGFFLTAYTKETQQWGLSNWIWTSSAVARVLSILGYKEDAKAVADTFINNQLHCGGWIVRYDILNGKVVRLAAPNDSAYIARNSLLVTYKDTLDKKYLDAAIKCADWIIDTSCEDGLVLFGYDVDEEKWIEDRNIVDIGFTACLFSDLYDLTGQDKYKIFLGRFIKSYIDTFYDANAKLFASHIGRDRKQNGGYFSRGQAWALEGMISAYELLKEKRIYEIVEDVTQSIIKRQRHSGGWYCNFQKSRSLMGEDCKGIACIGKALLDWSKYSEHKEELERSARKALSWCEEHTDEDTGMILSFSCNGAISHSLNTSTGMLYANAYALEIDSLLLSKC